MLSYARDMLVEPTKGPIVGLSAFGEAPTASGEISPVAERPFGAAPVLVLATLHSRVLLFLLSINIGAEDMGWRVFEVLGLLPSC